MRAGLVSTIIPVFNRPEMLAEAVRSVLEQSYKEVEIIIIDDGSTDETPAVAEQLKARHAQIRVEHIKNSGPGAARQAGVNIAHGEYIQYLDSDDLLMPEKFEKQVGALTKAPDASVCYCKTSIHITQENRTITAWKRTGEQIDSILPSMLAGRWWGTSTPLYRANVCHEAGAWTTLINEEDWEYDCRVGLVNNRLAYVPETLSLERQHASHRLSQGGSTDASKLSARAQAHQQVIAHAVKAGFDTQTLEFVTLLKASFLLSRQCGAAGLSAESKALFQRSFGLMKPAAKGLAQFYIYRAGTLFLGWRLMGKIALLTDRLRA